MGLNTGTLTEDLQKDILPTSPTANKTGRVAMQISRDKKEQLINNNRPTGYSYKETNQILISNLKINFRCNKD